MASEDAPGDARARDGATVSEGARRNAAARAAHRDVRAPDSHPALDAGTAAPFAYAVLRVVPSLERGERLNAGVVVFSRRLRFLGVEVELDVARLEAFAPGCDAAAVRAHLDGLARVAAGDTAAGAIARADPSERFGWIVAPSSTMVQASEVHTGLTDDAPATLERLAARLLR